MKRNKMIAALLCLCMLPGLPAMQASAAEGVLGDVSGNGEVDVLDAVYLQKWILGVGELPVSVNADVNEDGSVDIFDLGQLKQWLYYGVRPNYSAELLSRKVTAAEVDGLDADAVFVQAQVGFAIRLLQETAEDGVNTLVSPYSVTQALAMTANGADGDTLTEMENTLGGVKLDSLNRYLYTQRINQPDTDDCKLLTANSIWVRDSYPVADSFLQTNANFYDAAVFRAPFDDTTIRDINRWSDTNTDHMIPRLIEELSPNDQMALINAVVFDAKWSMPFDSETQVRDSVFTAADGKEQKARMLCGDVDYYLEDEHATGFVKKYASGNYAFAALLPEEGMTTSEYISTLSAEGLVKMVTKRDTTPVSIQLPKFSYSYDIKLNDALGNMGMPSAFDEVKADFTRMHTGGPESDVYISYVKHKTFISVTEEGTRAGAVTAVMMANKGIMMDQKSVILDRPFVYAIVDLRSGVPVFIGTVESLEE